MEFLQQEWINNGNFMGLGDERDPNVGLQEDGATFTIPQQPVRRRIHGIQTFNVLRGGEYFFMPSLSALEMDRRPPPAERTTLISEQNNRGSRHPSWKPSQQRPNSATVMINCGPGWRVTTVRCHSDPGRCRLDRA